MENAQHRWRSAAVFGASGGIGKALVEALLEDGTQRIHAGARHPPEFPHDGVQPFAFDLTDESSIARAVADFSEVPELVIVASGVLTLPCGVGPEKSVRSIDPAGMAQVLALNAIGPALVAKHILPRFPRTGRHVFAALSARVGSIGDNRIGGWHSYRASKAALNMLLRNFAIEMARTRPDAIVAGLHPGTVDTSLSEPFQANVPQGQLFTPQRSARALLTVLAGLKPGDSGGVFDWQGERIVD